MADYAQQSAEPMSFAERLAWFQSRAREMKAEGATFFQFSIDDATTPKICLIEGWRERQNPSPAPQFFMTKGN